MLTHQAHRLDADSMAIAHMVHSAFNYLEVLCQMGSGTDGHPAIQLH